ncbi:MAG: hypothetical protein HUU57_15820 [Bdellovibrio sp.]|nr:hypothetical protein [Bdellovibrio sp.]
MHTHRFVPVIVATSLLSALVAGTLFVARNAAAEPISPTFNVEQAINESLPQAVSYEAPLIMSAHVGRLITGTIYCSQWDVDQGYYLETSHGTRKIGVPDGPFQFWAKQYINDTLWMWGTTADLCGKEELWKYWWVKVQSTDKPYPAGNPQLVTGRLNYQPYRMPEFRLDPVTGPPVRPYVNLIVEHDPRMTERFKLLNGQVVQLMTIETEGHYSRTQYKDSMKYLWVTREQGRACDSLNGRVPKAHIAAALDDPTKVNGWLELLNPAMSAGPDNPSKTSLSMTNIGAPYDQRYNGLVYKAGCP